MGKIVYVITFGKLDSFDGDFYDYTAYLDYSPAFRAAEKCMVDNGGVSVFKQVPCDLDHVKSKWSSSQHSVWLEVLNVQGTV